MSERIVVVEDDTGLREALAYSLTREGYDVVAAADGPTALDLVHDQAPDVMILDVMLPGMDGFEVCQTLRTELEMNIPVLMLTARTDTIDKVKGLEVGADDYLTKPFNMWELKARVKALIRRMQMIRDELEAEQISNGSGRKRMRFENLVIDESRREVMRDGEPLSLKPKEYELLVYLARHNGIALSRDQILQEVWGWDYDGGTRTVDVHIRWLREKIEDMPSNPAHIITVRGLGYRFEG
jgi:DNA-binding response OmpR family regulator